MNRERVYYFIIGGGGLVVLAAVIWYAWPESATEPLPPPAVLAEQLKRPAEVKQKVKAARDFIRHGAAARVEVRNALTRHEQYDPEVVTPLVQATMKNRDYRSMPILLDLLEHEDPRVRGRAGAAVQKILGADFGFRANLPEHRRAKVIATIRHDYDLAKERFSTVYGNQ